MSYFKQCAGIAAGAAILSTIFATVSLAAGDESRYETLDKSKFSNSASVDNLYMPLKPGTQYIYDGFTGEEDERIQRTVIFTVTDLVKEIDGVQCVVVWDQDIEAGELIETVLAFFAQDNDGNVWNLGELVEIYEDGEFVGGQAWLIGHLDEVRAGIMMKAAPEVDGIEYSQGFAPAPFFWSDRAETVEMGVTIQVPYGTFENVLISAEYSEDEPEAKQLKYYAPNVGVIRVGWTGEDSDMETLELVEVKNLTPAEMDDVREEALKLETRAYVYGSTPPAMKN